MRDWLQENALALYAAVVGTLGLVLTLARFVYDRRKDHVQLRVVSRKSPDFAKSAAALSTATPSSFDVPKLLPGYMVTVYNDGSIPAHLADAGIVDSAGTDVPALTPASPQRPMILMQLGQVDLDPITAKSSRTFTVYLRAGQTPPRAAKCYVVDKTGRRWIGKHSDL